MLKKADYLEMLEGQEILSLRYEGCVGIIKGKIWQAGKVIDSRPTKKTLQALFSELVRQG